MSENKNKPLTKAQRAILDTAVAIRHEASTIEDAAFLARQFVQATLPHSDPKSDTWRRVNGNFSLGIQAGFDPETGTKYGVPYGVIPRLLLFWITTEAVRTKNPRLVLGSSLSDFMREVGLNPDTGGGKRSDAKRLHEQCLRLFNARISFVGDTVDGERVGKDRRTLEVTDHQVLWWDKRSPGQATLWLSYVDLTPKFFAAITAAPIPVDTRALRVLKQSPLALDLYALSCYEAFRIEQTGHTRVIPWRSLMQQLGADYQAEGAEKEFARKCRSAMRKVAAVMPGLRVAYQKGELCILAGSKTAIPRKKLATA
jgi:hypothetical protein